MNKLVGEWVDEYLVGEGWMNNLLGECLDEYFSS